MSLAAYYTEIGRTLEARQELEGFATAFPSSEALRQVTLTIAQLACTENDPQAEDLLKAVIEASPLSAEASMAQRRLAYLYATKNRPKTEVQSAFLDVSDRYPDSPAAMECLFRAAKLDLKDPPDFALALQRFQRIRENAGDRRLRAEALTEIGLTHLQRFYHDNTRPEDFSDAFNILRSVRTEYPDQGNSVARAELRIANYHLYTERKPELAKPVLEGILSSYPDTSETEVLYQLAYCPFMAKDYQGAIDKCAAIISDPDVDSGWKAFTLYFRAHCYRQKGDCETARREYQYVADRFPGTDFAKAAKESLRLMPGCQAD